MSMKETGFSFTCEGESLIGLVSEPDHPDARGVLIVVGGPQYRAGSHRQFTLLARHLAQAGIPAMRFDYRGMGDSGGEIRTFEQIEQDIRAGIDAFFERVPDLKEIVLWGLCDAASAILFYAHADPRVSGIVLVNPWIRTPEGLAKAQLKHYYVTRLLDPALWRKILAGEFSARTSIGGLVGALLSIFPRAGRKGAKTMEKSDSAAPLPERMRNGMMKFKGKVLFILSGNDLTAREFEDTIHALPKWQELLKSTQISNHKLPEADHTFSRRKWRDQVALWTEKWVDSW